MVTVIFFISSLIRDALSNSFATSGGPAWCFSGGGTPDDQVTKDCCAAVNHNAYYNTGRTCVGRGGPASNGFDSGKFAECCGSRGRGAAG